MGRSVYHLHDDRLSDKAKMLFTVLLSLIQKRYSKQMYEYITKDFEIVGQPTNMEEE